MHAVLDCYSGGGGWSEGFRQSGGYRILAGVDSDKHARAAFERNFPGAKARPHNMMRRKRREALVESYKGKIDVLVAGPPCQGFSKLHRTAKNRKTRKLLPITAAVGIKMGAGAILIENAEQALDSEEMTRARAKLRKAGYEVHCEVLSFADYGVPQKRKRTILVGVKAAFREESHRKGA